MSNQHAEELRRLQETRTRLVGRELHKPFLEEPAQFHAQRVGVSTKHDGTIIALPPLRRDPPIMALAEVIGAKAVNDITGYGKLVFHAVGDTGNADPHSEQALVAESMNFDYHRRNPADRPAFFLHLGDVCYDVIYGPTIEKAPMYDTQFYTPYRNYPGQILAAAGNHDSNPDEAKDAIQAFMANFCAPLPTGGTSASASNSDRPPIHQPGVYYRLDAPFADIIVLFSNGGEYVGAICSNPNIAGSDVVGPKQFDFLVDQLKAIKDARGHGPRKALLIVVHHPPYSGGGGHSGSGDMLNDLDRAFDKAGISPDAVLAAHSHCYQRFTRIQKDHREVPYIVAGMGGHGITPLKLSRDRTPVRLPLDGVPTTPGGRSDNALHQYFNGYGHMYITVTKDRLQFDMIGTHANSSTPVDSVAVDLNTGKIVDETPPFAHPADGEQEPQHHGPRRPAAGHP
jgi:hypothetical protein